MSRTFLFIPFLLVVVFRNYANVEALKHKNVTSNSTASPWLRKMLNPRSRGCRYRPWICIQDRSSSRSLKVCCRNRCVDVGYDVNNCGMCGIRCPFNWQCCRGVCVNTNINPFNCGKCNNRCRFPSLCLYGLCGYTQPFPYPRYPSPPTIPDPPYVPNPPPSSSGSHPPYAHQPPPPIVGSFCPPYSYQPPPSSPCSPRPPSSH